jgi:HEAT repeat protein/MFS family permease
MKTPPTTSGAVPPGAPPSDPAPARLPEVRLRRALRLNIVCGSMAFVWLALMQNGYLTGFLVDIGATTWQIGLIASIAMAAVAVQIPAAFLIERLGRRKAFWGLTALAHRAIWWVVVAVALMGGGAGTWKPWVVVAVAGLSSLVVNAAVPVWFSWMTDLVPEERRAKFFGRRHAICMTVYLIHVALSGIFMDRMPDAGTTGNFTGYAVIFAYGAFFGCLDIILHLWIPEPPMTRVDRKGSLWREFGGMVRDRQFMLFAAISALYMLGAQISAPFWIPFFRKEWEMNWTFMIGVMGMLTALSAIPGSRIWGYVSSKYGYKPVIILTLLGPMLYWLDWLVISDARIPVELPSGRVLVLRNYHIVLTINALLGGFFWTGFNLAMQNLAMATCPQKARSIYLAARNTIQGVAAAAGPLVGSRIITWAQAQHFSYELFTGTRATYMHLAMAGTMAVWIVVLALLFWIREPGEKPVGLVFGRMITINPLRLVRNLHTITYARTPERKADAVRALAHSKAELAIEELIERIEDPDHSVRASAVEALGLLGAPEAIEVLEALLEDPESDVRAPAARALGKIADARVPGILLPHLEDPDTEVQHDVAAALGRYAGEERVVEALLARLDALAPGPVFAAAAETLSRASVPAALPRILAVYGRARNQRIRNRLAVSVADIAGRAGQFYPLLCREMRAWGSGVRVAGVALRREIVRRLRDDEETADAAGKLAIDRRRRELAAALAAFREAYEEERLDAAAAALVAVTDGLEELVGPGREALLAGVRGLMADQVRPASTEVMLGLYLLVQAVRPPEPAR